MLRRNPMVKAFKPFYFGYALRQFRNSFCSDEVLLQKPLSILNDATRPQSSNTEPQSSNTESCVPNR